jgi:hypothetical protein
MTPEFDKFERSINKVERAEFQKGDRHFDTWTCTLSCGHVSEFVTWPSGPTTYCTQCLHEWLEKEKAGGRP